MLHLCVFICMDKMLLCRPVVVSSSAGENRYVPTKQTSPVLEGKDLSCVRSCHVSPLNCETYFGAACQGFSVGCLLTLARSHLSSKVILHP